MSAGLVFVLVAIPPQWLNTTSARWLLFVLGVLCLGGAAYEWWFRKADQSASAGHGQSEGNQVTYGVREQDGQIQVEA